MKETVIITKGESPAKIIKKIMALPPLEESGFLQVDPRRTIVCLQGECGVLDYSVSHGEHPIRYIGTKNLFNCIFVVVKTEHGECYFAHVSKVVRGKLFEGINRFHKPSSCLEVTIIGGMPTQEEKAGSTAILEEIVTQLIGLADVYTITVVGQRLLEHNYQKVTQHNYLERVKTREEYIAQNKLQMYQRFCATVRILYLYLYGLPLNSAYIDVGFPSPQSFNREIKLPTEQSRQLMGFVSAISHGSGILSQETLNKVGPEVKQKGNRANFYQLISRTLSYTGLQFLDATGFGLTGGILTDFVIDLKTGAIFSVPRHIKTYHEELREAHCCDSMSDPETHKLFLFFCGQHYQPTPQLTMPFVMAVYAKAEKLIEQSKYFNTAEYNDDKMAATNLQLYYFRKKWSNEVPSLREHHASVLADSLSAIFALNIFVAKGLRFKDHHALLISEYATADCCDSPRLS